jgi:DNA repair ATPase RecN
MRAGFQLRALRVTGKMKEPAEIAFGPGLNVISGASSTGKSYLLQCIDFACGAGTKPKVIDESI